MKNSIVGIAGRDGFIGCGFAVTSRHILTCAHVAKAALNLTKDSRNELPTGVINVCFPYLGNKQVETRVVYWRPDSFDVSNLPSFKLEIEEDIAGLELLEDVPEVHPAQFTPYGKRALFGAFGYPKKTPQGAVAQGTIQEEIPFGWVQIDGERPEGFWVAPGYSGTPLWDIENGSIIYGMMVAVRRDDDMAKKIAYMIPHQRLKRAIAFLNLLNSLPRPTSLEDDEIWNIYLSVYERCQPDEWKLGNSMPKTPSELLAQVNNMGQSDLVVSGKPLERTVEFVARFLTDSRLTLAESEKQKLRDWGSQQCSEFLSVIDRIQREQMQPQNLEPEVADPCLMLEVSPDYPPYMTRAFFIPDSKTYDEDNHDTWNEIFCWDFQRRQETIEDLEPFDGNLENLKARLRGYIKTCKESYQPDLRFRMELILPLSLMSLPIERLKLELGRYQSIVPGSTFPVVIRSYVRTTEDYQHELSELWKTNWRKLQANINSIAHACLEDVPAIVEDVQLQAAYRHPRTVGFKLSEVLMTSAQENFFGALLRAAAPVAVWLRQTPQASSPTGENQAQQLLSEILQYPIGELFNRIVDVRAEAIKHSTEPDDTTSMVGHHLALLWENPHLVPPIAPKYVSE